MKRLLDIQFLRRMYDAILALLHISVGSLLYFQEPPVASTLYLESLTWHIVTHREVGLLWMGIAVIFLVIRTKPWHGWLLCVPLFYATIGLTLFLLQNPDRASWVIPFFLFASLIITLVFILFQVLDHAHH